MILFSSSEWISNELWAVISVVTYWPTFCTNLIAFTRLCIAIDSKSSNVKQISSEFARIFLIYLKPAFCKYLFYNLNSLLKHSPNLKSLINSTSKVSQKIKRLHAKIQNDFELQLQNANNFSHHIQLKHKQLTSRYLLHQDSLDNQFLPHIQKINSHSFNHEPNVSELYENDHACDRVNRNL